MTTEGIPVGKAVTVSKPAEIFNLAPGSEKVTVSIPAEIVNLAPALLERKRRELTQAEEALEVLRRKEGISERRVKRVSDRLTILRKTVKAIEAGFLPIPAFDSQLFTNSLENLPLKALVAIDEAQAQKVFDEVRIVFGRESDSHTGRRRLARRDPLIVGVVRTPERQYSHVNGEGRLMWRDTDRGLEEHFLIAWWRPEELSETELF